MMAENGNKRIFPRLPAKNWWTLRERFKQTMPSRVDADYLQSVLGLTSAASAGNLIGPLRILGLIDDEGRPTDRAFAWREDESYKQICEDMLTDVYTDALRSAFPDPSPVDSSSVANWFRRNTGVGQSAALGMAALYTLISVGDLEAGRTNASPAASQKKDVAKKAATKPQPKNGGVSKTDETTDQPRRIEPALNINVQIHISSDASPDQIDQIFKSMAEHLYGSE